LPNIRRVIRVLSAAALAAGLFCACSGPRDTSTSSLPTLAHQKLHAADTASATDVVAINAGGSATGSFAADEDFNAGTWTYKVANTIDTSAVTNPAPQAVYADEREGQTITYTIPGLSAGAAYTVKLSFAELWWTAAGQRVFNVTINNTKVLSNFDVFATTGARFKAVAESFAATANGSGAVVITLSAVTDNAAIDGIEIAAGGSTPTAAPTPTPAPAPAPASGLFINAGGSATGSFAADKDFNAGTWTYATTSGIVTTGVTNPAPQAVYQDEREGPTITYTIPALTAGAKYAVRLDFAELWWTAAGQRIFNATINGTKVLTNFDIYATAGARDKAVAESFTATASASGTVVITLTAVTDNAAITGIEISPGSGAPTTPVPATPTPTAVPTSPSSTSFVDWPTYAYDAQRSGFNPSSTAFNPGSISSIKLGWQTPINGSTQSQPIVATGIGGHQALLVVADFALAQAYDGLTGSRVWQTTLPTQDVQTCGVGGISGTAVYDKALGAIFMVAGKGSGSPNHVILYELNVATGAIMNSVDVTPSLEPGEANYSHAGVSMANGMIYVGTGSDCEGSATATYPSWRGRVAAVNPASMTLEKTFFTSWQVGSSPGNYGGGGVWSWGGVSADASGNIYVSTGNGETNSALGSQQIQPPFTATTNEQAGLSENVIELSGDLSTVKGSNYPGFNFTIGRGDLDFAGTPVIFQPPGCGVLSATQGKAGLLVVNNTQNAMSLVQTFGLSVPSSSAYYMGNPAYSPVTGYLYAPISSSGAGSSMLAPGLAAISGCGTSIVWHAQFGPDSSNYSGDNPRSGPTVTAGGVVFIGTPCTPDGSGGCGGVSGTASGAVWAIDASSGTVLNNQKPILITGANIRMAPSVDGLWVYVLDGAGNFYGLTIDPTVQAKTVKPGNHTTTSTYKYHDNE
jgi:hypothetical protein